MRESGWLRLTRVVVLSLLGLFTVVPVYAMITSAVKPLRDVQGPFRWFPSQLIKSCRNYSER